MIKNLSNMVVTLVASALLIVMGLVYFIMTLWIVKIGAGVLGYNPDANFAVLAAALIAVGTIIGSAIQK